MAEKKSKATGCYLRKRRSIGSNLINSTVTQTVASTVSIFMCCSEDGSNPSFT